MQGIRNLVRIPIAAAVALLAAAPLLLAGEAAPAEAAAAAAADSAAARGLARFKALAGEWVGTNAEGQTVRLSYEVVSDGQAVLEHLNIGETNPHNMVTVYHLDGDRLMLTHYCAAANQPRMASGGLDGDEIHFELQDITNLPSPESGHMHRAKFRFDGDDALAALWTWQENGEDRFSEALTMRREATAKSAGAAGR